MKLKSLNKLKDNKKGEFTTSDFVIAGLLFSSIVAFYVLAIAGISHNYPNNANIISEDFSNNYDTLTQQADSINLMRSTSTAGEGLSFRGTFDVAFASFFTVIQLVFSTLGLFGTMYVNFMIDFTFLDSSVTVIFFTLGLAILTTILVIRLINSIGRNPV